MTPQADRLAGAVEFRQVIYRLHPQARFRRRDAARRLAMIGVASLVRPAQVHSAADAIAEGLRRSGARRIRMIARHLHQLPQVQGFPLARRSRRLIEGGRKAGFIKSIGPS